MRFGSFAKFVAGRAPVSHHPDFRLATRTMAALALERHFDGLGCKLFAFSVRIHRWTSSPFPTPSDVLFMQAIHQLTGTHLVVGRRAKGALKRNLVSARAP